MVEVTGTAMAVVTAGGRVAGTVGATAVVKVLEDEMVVRVARVVAERVVVV